MGLRVIMCYCERKVFVIEVEIPRGRIGLNYLSKFVWIKWAVWLMYSSSWILVWWKFYCLTNSNASSIYANWSTVLTSDEKSRNCQTSNLSSLKQNTIILFIKFSSKYFTYRLTFLINIILLLEIHLRVIKIA